MQRCMRSSVAVSRESLVHTDRRPAEWFSLEVSHPVASPLGRGLEEIFPVAWTGKETDNLSP